PKSLPVRCSPTVKTPTKKTKRAKTDAARFAVRDVPHCLRNSENPARMKQAAAFTFIATSDGWILLRASLPNIQPASPRAPINIVKKVRTIDVFRHLVD